MSDKNKLVVDTEEVNKQIDELSEKWRVKVDESWLKRYFTNP